MSCGFGVLDAKGCGVLAAVGDAVGALVGRASGRRGFSRLIPAAPFREMAAVTERDKTDKVRIIANMYLNSEIRL